MIRNRKDAKKKYKEYKLGMVAHISFKRNFIISTHRSYYVISQNYGFDTFHIKFLQKPSSYFWNLNVQNKKYRIIYSLASKYMMLFLYID